MKRGTSVSEPMKAKEIHIINDKEAKIARVTIVLPRSGTTILAVRGRTIPTIETVSFSLSFSLWRGGDIVSPTGTCEFVTADASAGDK